MSSEYGWTDEVILDLTLARLRQVVAVIRLRAEDEFESRVRMHEWSTRTLSVFIVASGLSGSKKLAKAAASISLLDDHDRPTVDVGDDDKDRIERVAELNGAGSFERLTAGLR